MLQIQVPESELFDSEKNEFVYIKEQTLILEHSLLSVSKWESRWKKPYLHTPNKTWEEAISYIQCMTINKGINPVIYQNLTRDVVDRIDAYIEDSMTASNVPEPKGRRRGANEQITSETIYFWMVNYNIPFECEKWHLNRLLALIKVCSYKSQSSEKKVSEREKAAKWHEINMMRRKALKSKG